MHSKWRLKFLRYYGRVAEWARPSELRSGLQWALLVGILAGFGAIGFREILKWVLWAWSQKTGNMEDIAAQLPWWIRLVVPAIGGLLAGLVLYFGARFGHRDRSTDYMEAVAVQRGVISTRQSLAKTISSVLTIDSGGSVGREGAMVQLSATLASALGRKFKLSTPRLRLIVACGAAGGLAAIYNVTVAGALFVAEIILGSIATESLGPLLVAAAASSFISRYLGGAQPYFTSPPFKLASPWEIFAYLTMGIGLGFAAPAWVWLLRRAEDLMNRAIPHLYTRLAIGGLIVGVLSIAFPEVWGNGRTMVNLVLSDPWPAGLLAALLVCKAAATAATTGSGAVGGVFTPTLFTGAMLGCLFGQAVAKIWPHPEHLAQAYALVGMAGFLAATTRAPLMAISMLLEMTLNYGAVIPITSVCVVSYYTARMLHSDSIYSESLRRKQARTTRAEISTITVREVMKPSPPAVLENASPDEIVRHFESAPFHHLYVVTLQGELRGVIRIEDVEKMIERRDGADWTSAASLMQPDVSVVTPEMTLADAWERVRSYEGERIPVVDDLEDRKLIGLVSKTDLLLTMAHGLKGSTH